MTGRDKIAAIVLCAGQGTRMKSARPKVLHEVAGRAMIRHILDGLGALGVARTIVVVAPGMDAVATAVAPAEIAVQERALGTGNAVAAARSLAGFDGDILILYGDTPLLTIETMRRMIAARRAADNPALVVLGFRPIDPGEYGRLVLGPDGRLDAIIEHRDAAPAQHDIGLCNAGIMAADGRRLFELVGALENDNAKREYYLTDIVALARARNFACAAIEAPDAEEVMGVNARAELALAEAAMQRRLRARAMAEGATLKDPDTVYLSYDTRLGRDVTIGPQVVFGPNVVVEDGVEIRAFCHIEGARIGQGAIIGPFARLRPGADIGTTAHIGNFVEIKAAKIEEGARVNHLSYVGDARVGAGANIGAGTITCNYDGFTKARTDIGAGAFIGSNTAIVAPVKIGDGAIIGAGSVVTEDVPKDALAIGRGKQVIKPGRAAKLRAERRAPKAAE